MLISLARVRSTPDSTLGAISIDGWPRIAWTLEDGHHVPKIPGQTRIPAGTYPVTLRTEGGAHARYLTRFGADFHKGMLWLGGVPDFRFVLIHCGNTVADTEGCILVGLTYSFFENRAFTLGKSEAAYRLFYIRVREALLRKEDVLICVADELPEALVA